MRFSKIQAILEQHQLRGQGNHYQGTPNIAHMAGAQSLKARHGKRRFLLMPAIRRVVRSTPTCKARLGSAMPTPRAAKLIQRSWRADNRDVRNHAKLFSVPADLQAHARSAIQPVGFPNGEEAHRRRTLFLTSIGRTGLKLSPRAVITTRFFGPFTTAIAPAGRRFPGFCARTRAAILHRRETRAESFLRGLS